MMNLRIVGDDDEDGSDPANNFHNKTYPPRKVIFQIAYLVALRLARVFPLVKYRCFLPIIEWKPRYSCVLTFRQTLCRRTSSGAAARVTAPFYSYAEILMQIYQMPQLLAFCFQITLE